MKKLLLPAQRRIIAVILVFILILPIMLMTSVGIAEASMGSLISDKTTALRGVLMILMAFLLERLVGDQKVKPNFENPPTTDWPNNPDNPYPSYPNYLSPGEKEVLGFYVNWKTPGNESYPSLVNNAKNIDMVSPFWYTVTKKGDLQPKSEGHQPQTDSLIRKNGQLILPLINNDKTNSTMLTDTKIRKKAIDNIIGLIQQNNYDGVNIDFELIPAWSKDAYTAFIRELGQKLHARGKLLVISVFPKVGVPHDIMGAYDYKALAPHIDRMVIMTYDNHWSGGSAASSPLNWVEENILYALREVPAEKIILGIANYGYDWPVNNGKNGQGQDIAAKKAIDLAKRKGATVQWDSEAKVPYFYYSDSNKKLRTVWFENSYSLDFKLRLVNKYNLKGIGIWRLGNEEDRFWDIVQHRLNK